MDQALFWELKNITVRKKDNNLSVTNGAVGGKQLVKQINYMSHYKAIRTMEKIKERRM